MKIFTFGDSWAAGWGLKKTENNFTDFLGKELGCPTKNYGKSGSSLGQIAHDFICRHAEFLPGDLIIVIIPPDTRWYDEIHGSIKSVYNSSSKDYKKFLKGKTDYWFIYHHSLFMHTIYNICKAKEVSLIFAHNYGKLSLMSEFKSHIPEELFLNFEKSLTELLGVEDWKENYKLKYTGPPSPFIGPYFIKDDTHPNELGHRKIADMLLQKYKKEHT